MTPAYLGVFQAPARRARQGDNLQWAVQKLLDCELFLGVVLGEAMYERAELPTRYVIVRRRADAERAHLRHALGQQPETRRVGPQPAGDSCSAVSHKQRPPPSLACALSGKRRRPNS